MSVTTQRAVAVCLDENMTPLRPAIGWLDQRRTNRYPKAPLWLELGIRAAGQKKTIHYFQSKAECNWLAVDDPDVWRRTRHFVFLSGYLNLKLTGRLCDAVAFASRLCAVRRQAPAMGAGRATSNGSCSPFSAIVLPELVPAGGSMGRITAEAADETGIPSGPAGLRLGRRQGLRGARRRARGRQTSRC